MKTHERMYLRHLGESGIACAVEFMPWHICPAGDFHQGAKQGLSSAVIWWAVMHVYILCAWVVTSGSF
jgi:hypothetical protein